MGGALDTDEARVAANKRSAPGTALAAGCAAFAGLVSCTAAGDASPDRIELANIRPGYIVPRTSPSRLTATFKDVCLARTIDEARAALRAKSYVPAQRAGSAVESYFADDTQPAVALRGEGVAYDCAVHARARTGQANAVDAFVAETFPNAQRATVPDASKGTETERFWRVAEAKTGAETGTEKGTEMSRGFLFTQRVTGRPATPRDYIFGILRSTSSGREVSQ